MIAVALVIASFAAPAASAAPLLAQHPTTDASDLPLVRTARVQTVGMLTLSVSGEYYESMDIASFLGTDSPARYTSFYVDAGYGLLPWLDVSAVLPFRRVAWDVPGAGTGDVTGLDAPRVGFRAALPLSGPTLSLAASGRASLPVGDELVVGNRDGGTLHLTGGSSLDWEAMVLATVDLTPRLPMRLHANVGWAVNGNDDGRRFFPDYYPAISLGGASSDNDALILRGAVEFPGRRVDLFTEFRGDMIMDDALVAAKENELTVSPGVRVRLAGGWTATGTVSVSISGDDRATPDFDPHDAYPDWSASLSLSYAWPVRAADSDGDGIPDFRDQCPMAPEDLDGFLDDDGCPDPDNDGDGIPDAFDGRPLLEEDYDGFEDDDGVPDLDNDGDGIIDERDMCPNEPEDLDGFEDEDGCPDL
jgi:hypothetical protein